ncbi:hypothetical protein ALQ04_01066 [Pseudomonas cichorii]|uniref:Glycosyltransferase 2-like domain-containing protein n=1 Tax=Pseudomonas cichorii TaxID=36746 RepID=A0A3M4LLE5_PSECI|nr:glycosyltransferase [Pseudomonas cichorii]RMQ42322.1 hypothetical protein ALQ04_01066 [Pseudomonas cichorii]
MVNKRFTFGVLTYNHEMYVVEHLESIRFLIENYGADYDFGLIIADDGSRDQTLELVNRWLLVHGSLFCDVKVLGDGSNNGTCFNYTRMWPLVEGTLFKITAGDDVYSYVNIFEEAEQLSANDFFSGLPLLLIDGEILSSRSTAFHILATDVIYKNKPLMERLKNISSINTPNLFCNKKFFLDEELSDYIKSYSVTEDFPMLVKIAERYRDVSFYQSSKVYVYYRRTSGSTYLVRGSDFDKDKLRVFNHMLALEQSKVGRFLLKNRLFCYNLNNKYLKVLCNLNYYVYLFRVITNYGAISRRASEATPDVAQHKSHYDLLCKRAADFCAGQDKP